MCVSAHCGRVVIPGEAVSFGVLRASAFGRMLRFRSRLMNTPIENEIAKRFGVLPNFFCLASSDPTIAANLWGFAQFAYLDNPLPSLFKERLFVYLSRFCAVRYCIARHLGFLVGLGRPSGDSTCLPQTVNEVLPLLRRAFPCGEAFSPLLRVCT